jgi:tetratricopeptide (TPR) repeat protein
MAHRALEYARSLADEDGEIAATALVGEALAMRGEAGDIERATELGDEALVRWKPGVRRFERADHLHLHGDLKYWVGDFEQTLRLATAALELGGDVHSMEAVLRGGGLQAMALTGLGRHEEALASINASMILRELNDLANARRTSELALERARTRSFGMPRRFAQSDLLLTALLEGDVGRAQVEWPALWEDAAAAPAWTRWLIRGRLAAARAEIALRSESPEAAVEWAGTAIELAVSTRRRKYEAIARTTLGEALARLGRRDEALSALRQAVRIADELVGLPARFSLRATLARTAYVLGADDAASAANVEARSLVEEFVATLAPERAELVRASPVVRELYETS